MSSFVDDTRPVFELIVRGAVKLCNCKAAGVFEYDGGDAAASPKRVMPNAISLQVTVGMQPPVGC
jgi:hypothetical protein